MANKSKGWNYLLIIVLILLISIVTYSWLSKDNSEAGNNIEETAKIDTSAKAKAEFLKAATSGEDSVIVIRVSDLKDLDVPFNYDEKAGFSVKRVFSGRRVNIAVIGLDNRMGTISNHADANHIISILIDSGIVEITTIPRDTPADAGQPDTSDQNKLTIVRAMRGRTAYLDEAAKIAGLDKIHYYVEVGFSQVMGILDLLGFKDSRSTLQMLRSRTALGGDDYQRCYNQAQFIRQLLLRHFDKFSGLTGEVLIRGGLLLVESNLTAAKSIEIIDKLKQKNFPKNSESIVVRVRPPLQMKFRVYDFNDQNVVNDLIKSIEYHNFKKSGDSTLKVPNVTARLYNVIKKVEKDSTSHPGNVISGLQLYFEQRAWLQIQNPTERGIIRDKIADLMIKAYIKKKQPAKAQQVRNVVETEKELFSKQIFK